MRKARAKGVPKVDQVPDLGPNQHLSPAQVAAILGVGKQTVLDLCDPAAPKLRHYRPTPKTIWVLRRDLEAFIAASRIEPRNV